MKRFNDDGEEKHITPYIINRDGDSITPDEEKNA